MEMPLSMKMEVTAGEAIARSIQNYYHADEPWTPKLAFAIGKKLSLIKKNAKECFPNLDMITILTHLKNYSKEDLEEVLTLKIST